MSSFSGNNGGEDIEGLRTEVESLNKLLDKLKNDNTFAMFSSKFDAPREAAKRLTEVFKDLEGNIKRVNDEVNKMGINSASNNMKIVSDAASELNRQVHSVTESFEKMNRELNSTSPAANARGVTELTNQIQTMSSTMEKITSVYTAFQTALSATSAPQGFSQMIQQQEMMKDTAESLIKTMERIKEVSTSYNFDDAIELKFKGIDQQEVQATIDALNILANSINQVSRISSVSHIVDEMRELINVGRESNAIGQSIMFDTLKGELHTFGDSLSKASDKIKEAYTTMQLLKSFDGGLDKTFFGDVQAITVAGHQIDQYRGKLEGLFEQIRDGNKVNPNELRISLMSLMTASDEAVKSINSVSESASNMNVPINKLEQFSSALGLFKDQKDKISDVMDIIKQYETLIAGALGPEKWAEMASGFRGLSDGVERELTRSVDHIDKFRESIFTKLQNGQYDIGKALTETIKRGLTQWTFGNEKDTIVGELVDGMYQGGLGTHMGPLRDKITHGKMTQVQEELEKKSLLANTYSSTFSEELVEEHKQRFQTPVSPDKRDAFLQAAAQGSGGYARSEIEKIFGARFRMDEIIEELKQQNINADRANELIQEYSRKEAELIDGLNNPNNNALLKKAGRGRVKRIQPSNSTASQVISSRMSGLEDIVHQVENERNRLKDAQSGDVGDPLLKGLFDAAGLAEEKLEQARAFVSRIDGADEDTIRNSSDEAKRRVAELRNAAKMALNVTNQIQNRTPDISAGDISQLNSILGFSGHLEIANKTLGGYAGYEANRQASPKVAEEINNFAKASMSGLMDFHGTTFEEETNEIISRITKGDFQKESLLTPIRDEISTILSEVGDIFDQNISKHTGTTDELADDINGITFRLEEQKTKIQDSINSLRTSRGNAPLIAKLREVLMAVNTTIDNNNKFVTKVSETDKEEYVQGILDRVEPQMILGSGAVKFLSDTRKNLAQSARKTSGEERTALREAYRQITDILDINKQLEDGIHGEFDSSTEKAEFLHNKAGELITALASLKSSDSMSKLEEIASKPVQDIVATAKKIFTILSAGADEIQAGADKAMNEAEFRLKGAGIRLKSAEGNLSSIGKSSFENNTRNLLDDVALATIGADTKAQKHMSKVLGSEDMNFDSLSEYLDKSVTSFSIVRNATEKLREKMAEAREGSDILQGKTIEEIVKDRDGKDVKQYRHDMYHKDGKLTENRGRREVVEDLIEATSHLGEMAKTTLQLAKMFNIPKEELDKVPADVKKAFEHSRRMLTDNASQIDNTLRAIIEAGLQEDPRLKPHIKALTEYREAMAEVTQEAEKGSSILKDSLKGIGRNLGLMGLSLGEVLRRGLDTIRDFEKSSTDITRVVANNQLGGVYGQFGPNFGNAMPLIGGQHVGSTMFTGIEGMSDFPQQYRTGLSDMQNRIAKRLGMQGEGIFYSGTDVAALNAQFMRETAGVQNIRGHVSTVGLHNLLGDENNLRSGGQEFGVGESIARFAAFTGMERSDSMNTFVKLYKELGQSIDGVEYSMYKMAQTARASGTPITEHVKNVMELAESYKKWGDVSGVADDLIGQFRGMGFSSMQSKEMTNNMFNSAANMSLGQATYFQQFQHGVSNPFTAMRNAFDIYDENGKIREDKLFERIGDTMDFLDQTVNFGTDPDEVFMNRALVLQRQFGYDNATASVIARNPENRDKVREAVEKFDRRSDPSKLAEDQLEELSQIKTGVSNILQAMGDAQPWEQARATVSEHVKSVGEQILDPFSGVVRDLTNTVSKLSQLVDKFMGVIGGDGLVNVGRNIQQNGLPLIGRGIFSDTIGGVAEAAGLGLQNLGTIPGMMLAAWGGKKLLGGVRGSLSKLFSGGAKVESAVAGGVAGTGLLSRGISSLSKLPGWAKIAGGVAAAGLAGYGIYSMTKGSKNSQTTHDDSIFGGSGSSVTEEGIQQASSVVREIKVTNAILNQILAVLSGGKVEVNSTGQSVITSGLTTVSSPGNVIASQTAYGYGQPQIAIPLEDPDIEIIKEHFNQEALTTNAQNTTGIGGALVGGLGMVAANRLLNKFSPGYANLTTSGLANVTAGKELIWENIKTNGVRSGLTNGMAKDSLGLIGQGMKSAGKASGIAAGIGSLISEGIDLFSKDRPLEGKDFGRAATNVAGSTAGAWIGGAVGALGGPIGIAAGSIIGSMIGDSLGRWAGKGIFGENKEEKVERENKEVQELVDLNKDYMQRTEFDNVQKNKYLSKLDALEATKEITEAQRKALEKLANEGVAIKNLDEIKTTTTNSTTASGLTETSDRNADGTKKNAAELAADREREETFKAIEEASKKKKEQQDFIERITRYAKSNGGMGDYSEYMESGKQQGINDVFNSLNDNRSKSLFYMSEHDSKPKVDDKLLDKLSRMIVDVNEDKLYQDALPFINKVGDFGQLERDKYGGAKEMLKMWAEIAPDEASLKLLTSAYIQRGQAYDKGNLTNEQLTMLEAGAPINIDGGKNPLADLYRKSARDMLAETQSILNQHSNRGAKDPFTGKEYMGYGNALAALLFDSGDLEKDKKDQLEFMERLTKAMGMSTDAINNLPLTLKMELWDILMKTHTYGGKTPQNSYISEQQDLEEEKRMMRKLQKEKDLQALIEDGSGSTSGPGSDSGSGYVEYDEQTLKEIRAAQATLEKLNMNNYESNRSQYLLSYKKPEHYKTDTLPDIERPYLPSYLPDGHLNDVYTKPTVSNAGRQEDSVKSVTIPEIKFQTSIQIPNVNMQNSDDIEKMKANIDQAILSASRQLRQELQEKIREAIWQRGY